MGSIRKKTIKFTGSLIAILAVASFGANLVGYQPIRIGQAAAAGPFATKCGDANGDSTVNSVDLVYTMKVAVGEIWDNLALHRVVDVTLDGTIDREDAYEILRNLVLTGQSALKCGLFVRAGESTQRVGEVASIPVHLHNGVSGFSGISLVATMENPEIALIEEVSLPEFGFYTVSTLPSSSVTINLVDFERFIEGTFKKKELIVLKLRILDKGESRVSLSLIHIDDDDGESLLDKTHLVDGWVRGTP